ncbi:MAG: hypothetical protein LBF27_26620 [Sphingobacterium sp.]|nr:hypothetical protein [Sphingobacterium sp.]
MTIPIPLVILFQGSDANYILMKIALLHKIDNALPDLGPIISNMKIHVRMELIQEHESYHIIKINKSFTRHTIAAVFKSSLRYLDS